MYRELTAPDSSTPKRAQLLKRSALGITMIAVAGWIWKWNDGRKNGTARDGHEFGWTGSMEKLARFLQQ